jgi:hypothetical protein
MPNTLKLPADMPRGLGNCGVVSVALLAGVTHAEALAAIFPDRNQKADGGATPRAFRRSNPYSTHHEERMQALNRLGFNVHHVERVNSSRPRLTTVAKQLPFGVSFMVRVGVTKRGGHVVTLRDGLIYDQGFEGIPAAEHRRYANCVCHNITYVTPKENPHG